MKFLDIFVGFFFIGLISGLSVDFRNNHYNDVEVWWEGSHGAQKLSFIESGKTQTHTTFVGHSFFFTDAETDQVVGEYVIPDPKGKKEVFEYIIISKTCDKDNINSDPSLCNIALETGTERVKRLLDESDEKTIERGREINNQRRLYHNNHQPKLVRNFGPVGFELRKFPENVYTELLNFLKNEKAAREAVEVWPKFDSYVNFWESPTTMVFVTEELKQKIFNAAKPILEEWVGLELEPTSCYGIRIYHNNSWLRNHVDTLTTHAVSAIINIDQKVDKPWPLEIFDHDGESHKFFLQPGDMLLYESAKCIHGREEPLQGEFYANLFVHYRPKVGWNYNYDMIE